MGESALPDLLDGKYEACLFDMDGVLTNTATVHNSAWKQTFDELLSQEAKRNGTAFVPFDSQDDYLTYVDGKPRNDGVRDFLASRNITMPEGSPSDPPSADTIWGTGNRKNELVLHVLATRGVEVYPDAFDTVHALREASVRTAVVSASANTVAVLKAAGISGLFDVRVDGNTVIRHHLRGKPYPDTFLAAASEIGVAPINAVVFEDALSGVAAGRAGGFGLVVGVDRTGQAHEQTPEHGPKPGHAADLIHSGADVVVYQLTELVKTGHRDRPPLVGG